VELKMNKKILTSVGILTLIGIMYFTFGGITGNVVGASMVDDGNVIKIPLDSISKTAQFFDYEGIEFFVVRAKDGSVKTAFNACDVCYRSKKGYRQEGDDMVCNNCGNHYRISGLGNANLKGGGCWPGYLEARIEGDYMVIVKSSLEAGRYRFS
jgi:uncharacterized membrane protein